MPTCLVILLKHLHTVSFLLSNNKGLYNLHPLIELFFVPTFHLCFSNSCQVLSAAPLPSCSLIVFLSETVEDCTQRLTSNLIAASSVQLRALGVWYGTPSEFPFSLPVSTSMSLSESARWSLCLMFNSRHGCFAISRWFGRYVSCYCSCSWTGGDRDLTTSRSLSRTCSPLG